MKKTFKSIGKKAIPATAAMCILFSVAPIGAEKASAGLGTVMDVSITGLGIVKDIWGSVGPIGTDGPGYGLSIDHVYAQNIKYVAPTFKSGEFSISMYHTEGNSNFTRPVKVLYPDGKTEIFNLKTQDVLKITEVGTIIDLNPNGKTTYEHDLLYITKEQLNKGTTGVALNEEGRTFLEQASGENKILVDYFYKQTFGEASLDGFKGLGVDRFSYLSDEQQKLATLTSKPVSKDVLWNYLTSDKEALAYFESNKANIIKDHSYSTQIISDKDDATKLIAKDSRGNIIKNSWVNTPDDSNVYYAGSDGVFLKGWQEIKGKTYYFNPSECTMVRKIETNGYVIYSHAGDIESCIAKDTSTYDLVTDTRINFAGKTLGFDNNAKFKRAETKIITNIDGTRNWKRIYYSFEDGDKYTGFKTIDNKKYYFKNGESYNFDIYQEIDGKKYYFNSDGEAKLTGLNMINDKLYYYDSTGEPLSAGWHWINDKYYYIKDSGKVSTGWFQAEGYSFPNYGYLKFYSNSKGELYINIAGYMYIEDGLYKHATFNSNGYVSWSGEKKSYSEIIAEGGTFLK